MLASFIIFREQSGMGQWYRDARRFLNVTVLLASEKLTNIQGLNKVQ